MGNNDRASDALPLSVRMAYWRNVLRCNHVQTLDHFQNSLIVEMRSALMNALDALAEEHQQRLRLEQHLQTLPGQHQEMAPILVSEAEHGLAPYLLIMNRLIQREVI